MKNNFEKIAEAVFIIAMLTFGFWVLSLGFRLIWEFLKIVFKQLK